MSQESPAVLENRAELLSVVFAKTGSRKEVI
jgi:hypothetical protein